MNTIPKEDPQTLLNQTYTPSAPIEARKFFSGRAAQLLDVMGSLQQKGRNVIIYGDRGVGKTSFSNIVKILCETDGNQVARIACDTNDTFESVWKKVLSRFLVKRRTVRENVIGFTATDEIKADVIPLYKLADDRPLTNDLIIQLLSYLDDAVVIIDEFDRLDKDKVDMRAMADLIKGISDAVARFKIILVAVAEDVTSLIEGHESIERNLQQIHMPMMTASEIKEIVEKGNTVFDIQFNPEVVDEIVQLSAGFPHFTHSLCYFAVYLALYAKNSSIEKNHLDYAIDRTVAGTHHSLKEAYRDATLATKKNIFKEVLFAASKVETDEYGYFQANDLKPILAELLKKPVQLGAFISHLTKFCTNERGHILKVSGPPNRRKYKFRNPMMKAFVAIKVIQEENDAKRLARV